jgi:hypothetical protein
MDNPGFDHVLTNIGRGVAMINDCLRSLFSEDYTATFDSLSGLYKVKLNDKWYLSKEDGPLLAIKEKYKLSWEK